MLTHVSEILLAPSSNLAWRAGVTSTGLLLLRMCDPRNKTPALSVSPNRVALLPRRPQCSAQRVAVHRVLMVLAVSGFVVLTLPIQPNNTNNRTRRPSRTSSCCTSRLSAGGFGPRWCFRLLPMLAYGAWRCGTTYCTPYCVAHLGAPVLTSAAVY